MTYLTESKILIFLNILHNASHFPKAPDSPITHSNFLSVLPLQCSLTLDQAAWKSWYSSPQDLSWPREMWGSTWVRSKVCATIKKKALHSILPEACGSHWASEVIARIGALWGWSPKATRSSTVGISGVLSLIVNSWVLGCGGVWGIF